MRFFGLFSRSPKPRVQSSSLCAPAKIKDHHSVVFYFRMGIRKGERVFPRKTHRRRYATPEPFVPLPHLEFEAQYRTRYCTSNFFDYRSDSFSLFCARIFPFFSDFLCQFICQKICQPQHPKKRLRKPYKNESAGSQNAVGRFVLIWLRTAFFVFTP